MHTRSIRLVSTFGLLLLLLFTGAANQTAYGQPLNLAPVGLSPDYGFPMWLTPNPVNYLPLKANQTSGLDWVASDMTDDGYERHWLMASDDIAAGGIHLIAVENANSGPSLGFKADLTLPPPEITGIPIEPGEGYDWESICLHPWTRTIFLAQEGHAGEVGIYFGMVTPGDIQPCDGAWGRSGNIENIPGHIANLRRLGLPGWQEACGEYVCDNMGVEGIACTDDRLFVGLETPYSFSERIQNELSTKFAIWSINSTDPADMENCGLLKIHDTADWATSLGVTIETICGLDAIDSNTVVGVDRDNTRLFVVRFSDEGEYVGGRTFYLSVPGPAPLPEDGCDFLDHLPMLVRPSLESVAVVPEYSSGPDGEPSGYYIYLAVDPWAPGWALLEPGWSCDGYERRLIALLPALYRYHVRSEMLEIVAD